MRNHCLFWTLFRKTKKLGITDYEGYKTTYKIYVEVLPSSKVELLNVNVDGSNASFSFVDYIYTTDENEVFGKIYSVSQDHKVKSRDGLITLTFSITNCPDGYSIKDNLKIYYLNEDEDYEEVKLGEVYEVSGLTVNNGILNLTINMMQLAKGGYYRVDLMLYGTKVHYYQVEFLKDIGLEGSILDLKHSAMSNLTIASNENIVYSYIDLGVIPNLDVTPVLEGNDIKYYITLFNVNGTMIPSYLDSITLSPYANINAARLINIFVDGNHLITYTIEIDVEAESGEIYTWTHYITERSTNHLLYIKMVIL